MAHKALYPYTIEFDTPESRNHVQRAFTDADRRSHLEELSCRNDLLLLSLYKCGMTDADIDLLKLILRNNPKLGKLVLSENRFTGKGLLDLAQVIAEHPALTTVNIGAGQIGGNDAAQACRQILSGTRNLEQLNIGNCAFDAQDCAIIADGILQAPRLRQFHFSKCCTDLEALETITHALGLKPLLSLANLDFPVETEEGQRTLRSVMQLLDNDRMLNLTIIWPYTPEMEKLVHINATQARHAAAALNTDPASLPYSTHAILRERWSAIETLMPNVNYNLYAAKDRIKAQWQDFLASLPGLPADASSVDALFTPDARGFSPLDNPALWEDTEAVFDFIDRCGQKLDDGLLNRCTPRGVSLLESGMQAAPLGQFIPSLNARGIQLRNDRLLGADGAPGGLYRIAEMRNAAGHLFRWENWEGASLQAFRDMVQALPEDARTKVPYHTLTALLSANTPSVLMAGGR